MASSSEVVLISVIVTAAFFIFAYVALNKKVLQCLPLAVQAAITSFYFIPCLPCTFLGQHLKYGHWFNEIDDKVLCGMTPVGRVAHLYNKCNVRAVVNCQAEYSGPCTQYVNKGIVQLRIPTVDHHEPSVLDMERAVEFIGKHVAKGETVYIHCKAGHGRAGAIAFCWLLQRFGESPEVTQVRILRAREVRKKLYQQKNVLAYYDSLQQKGLAKPRENTAKALHAPTSLLSGFRGSTKVAPTGDPVPTLS